MHLAYIAKKGVSNSVNPLKNNNTSHRCVGQVAVIRVLRQIDEQVRHVERGRSFQVENLVVDFSAGNDVGFQQNKLRVDSRTIRTM